MSVANLKEYSKRLMSNPELLDKMKTVGLEIISEHMSEAERLGLSFSEADLAAYRKERLGIDEDELADLSEEELEKIAGGSMSVSAAVMAAIIGAAVTPLPNG